MLLRLLRERSRARALKSLDILNGVSEPDFDRFVHKAADAFAAPISLLTLFHHDTVWVKAAIGFELQCVPRANSFCNHAVDRSEPLEVCDAHQDHRYRELPPVVGSPFIRYYLGTPLKLPDGTGVGVLCVLDTEPRSPASSDQKAFLNGLARQATQALERRAHIKGSIAA
jgi:GAF domain-containing protein